MVMSMLFATEFYIDRTQVVCPFAGNVWPLGDKELRTPSKEPYYCYYYLEIKPMLSRTFARPFFPAN